VVIRRSLRGDGDEGRPHAAGPDHEYTHAANLLRHPPRRR
jgi:hypothetical protein